MDKRLDIRCSESEIAAWRAAAGEVALSRWIRRVLNASSSVCHPDCLQHMGYEHRVGCGSGPSEVPAGVYAPGPSVPNLAVAEDGSLHKIEADGVVWEVKASDDPPAVAQELLSKVPERKFRPDPRPTSTKKKPR